MADPNTNNPPPPPPEPQNPIPGLVIGRDYRAFKEALTASGDAFKGMQIGRIEMQKEINNLQSTKRGIQGEIFIPSIKPITEFISSRQEWLNINGNVTFTAGTETKYMTEWRSPITHPSSQLSHSTNYGDTNSSDGSVKTWYIERWKIWRYVTPNSSGQNGEWERLATPIYDGTSEGYDDIDDDKIAESGPSNDNGTPKFTAEGLRLSADAWEFGHDWIYADPNTDHKKAYGLNFKINSLETEVGPDGAYNETQKFFGKQDQWNEVYTKIPPPAT